MPIVSINGVKLYYDEYGNGNIPVVFIHGARTSADAWREFCSLMPADYHCYALDLRGHGKSANIIEGNTHSQWAEDIYRFSIELNLGKFVCVGASMGGGVSLQLCINHPEVLRGVVLIVPLSAFRIPSTPEWREQLLTNWNNFDFFLSTFRTALAGKISEERLREHVKEAMLMKKEAVISEMDANEYFDVSEHLNDIKTPTLMVICGKDNIISPDAQWRSVKEIPGAKAVYFQDEGHLMLWENPRKLLKEVVSFISEL